MTQSAATGRQASIERRRAMSAGGKASLPKPMSGAFGTTAASAAAAPARMPSSAPSSAGGDARKASLQRRQALSLKGKTAMVRPDRIRNAPVQSVAQDTAASTTAKDCGCGCNGEKKVEAAPSVAPLRTQTTNFKPAKIDLNSTRARALARRKAQSERGKSATPASSSIAQSARAANPNMSSRDLAKALREARAKDGGKGKKPETRRIRPARPNPAEESLKVGVSETSHGQIVTGTMVGRDQAVTGDEASTCRAVTGTEYMGADVFREFCQSDPAKAVSRSEVTKTGMGNSVSGNKMGRASSVTGNESGSCRNVTGIEYVSSEQMESFCGTSGGKRPLTENNVSASATRKGKTVTGETVETNSKVTGGNAGSGNALTGSQYANNSATNVPTKVGVSNTLRGGTMTGTMVGRSAAVTGDEPGSCHNVTGDDYLGSEHFEGFCKAAPKPTDRKVGMSTSLGGESITGTMTGRGNNVTGDESGTCKAVTGTPYAGLDQAAAYCDPSQVGQIEARTFQQGAMRSVGTTGIRPGVGGRMTGDSRGMCEPLTGTPYVDSQEMAGACNTSAPKAAPQPATQPLAPGAVMASVDSVDGAVTGTSYERGHITGSFGKAEGRVTGTEEFRFGVQGQSAQQPTAIAPQESAAPESRVTGEGMSLKNRVTGDDWDRNERVTGTEGRSVMRNPTMRGGAMNSVMSAVADRPEAEESVSRVTGSSGSTEKGAFVTYSGGARG